jgi:DNA adenine methylase
MRLAFKGLPMQRLTINYTVGASGTGREPKGELLIANFPI